jgi:cation-transporting ATPase 13A3/4/5
VVYTGYTSRRGRIIRKILAKNPKSTEMFTRGLLFLGEVFIIAMILYFSTIAFAKSRNLSSQMIGMRFIDFLGWSFPPTLPIFFNLAYSFSVVRLKRNDVLCIDP